MTYLPKSKHPSIQTENLQEHWTKQSSFLSNDLYPVFLILNVLNMGLNPCG